jgi:hypothetical protein
MKDFHQIWDRQRKCWLRLNKNMFMLTNKFRLNL